MKRLLNVTVLLLIVFVGCDEFWTEGDSIVRDVNDAAAGVRAVLDSPAGQFFPPEWKLYGALGVAVASGLVNAWQEVRNNTMKKTTRAIVKGVERTDNPAKLPSEVKANIAEEMRRLGGDTFYARANKIVDKLKIS